MSDRFNAQFGSQDRATIIKAMPCVVCAAPPPSHNHHVRSRGAGGGPRDIVPLCEYHHERYHMLGHGTFQNTYQIDLASEAARLAEYLDTAGIK